MTFVTVVVPAYQESRNVPPLLAAIREAMATTDVRYEVLFVDDGSTDDTWTVLRRCAAEDRSVRAIRLSRNFGKESAIAAGLEHSSEGADAVIVMDADLQHPSSLLPEMISAWKEGGADVVEAVKNERGDESPLYRLASGLFYKTATQLSGIDLDNVSDFKLMDAKVVRAWRALGESNLFFRGMSAWVGFRRVRLSFDVRARQEGRSGFGILKLVRLALTGITAFTSFPLRLVTMAGLIFLFFSLVWGTRALVLKFSGEVIDGITTVILLLLIIGSMLMLALGVIGEYIARIYQEVKLRPRYVIAEKTSSGDEG